MRKLGGKKLILGLVSGLWLLATGCGETLRPTAAPIVTPTAPPTPADYSGVRDAGTVGVASRPQKPLTITPENTFAPTPTLPPDDNGNPDEGEEQVSRAFSDLDPALLEKLYGVPGPGGKLPNGTPAPIGKITRAPNRIAPTPTLNTNPQAVRIEALKNTPVSFMTAYRQSSLKLLEISRSARLVFASANILKSDRTVWTFFFALGDGARLWRVIYDSNGNRADVQEMAPAMAADVGLIDITKVLDSPALIDRAAQAGLNTGLPVDIVSFQVEGLSKLPCFIFTNVAQGKQIAVHAYTGQILRSDF